MYINDLPEGLTSNAKLFVDDSSIFSVADDSISSSLSLNEELSKILQWAYKWKIFFNPDASKEAHKIVFSLKNHSNHSDIYVNNMLSIMQNTKKKSSAILRY